jgi:hypothetical protein
VVLVRRLVRGFPGRPLRPAPPAIDDPTRQANVVIEVGHVDADGVAHLLVVPLTREAALDVIMVLATQLRIGGH